MMKKTILAAMASAVALVSAGSAQAQSVTSPAGMTFTVGSACTVTGNTIKTGDYTVGQTIADWEKINGYFAVGVATAGTAPSQEIMSLNCTPGTAWTAGIYGADSFGALNVKDPANNVVLSVIAAADSVDGVSIPLRAINGDVRVHTLDGTGNGKSQTVLGRYITTDVMHGDDIIMGKPLVAGIYNGEATAIVTF